MVLDASALVLACGRGRVGDEREQLAEQAAFTFAMARHAAVDLAQVFHTTRSTTIALDTRLPPAERDHLQKLLARVGVASAEQRGAESDGSEESTEASEGMVTTLDELRTLYEPYLARLATFLLMTLPPWIPAPGALDDWQTTPDGNTAPPITDLVPRRHATTHDVVG
jgi:hypothetical protein